MTPTLHRNAGKQKAEGGGGIIDLNAFRLLPSAFCSPPAANEVHNLDSIIFTEHSPGPGGATHHFAIQLDGDSLRWQVELRNEFLQ